MLISSYKSPTPSLPNHSPAATKVVDARMQGRDFHYALLVEGDFTLPSIDWDAMLSVQGGTEKPFFELLLSTFSEHYFGQPTRNGNILDIIATNRPDVVTDVTVETGVSDHDVLIVTMAIKVSKSAKKPRRVLC